VAGFVGLAVIAAACGSSTKKATDSTTSSSAAASSSTSVAASTSSTSAPAGSSSTTAAASTTSAAPSGPKAVVGGELKVGLESGISTLDPAASLSQPADKDIALAIYDPLMSFDKDNKFVPFLATDVKSSADLKTWTVTLQKGVKFHDGTDFNADAVVAHWKRMADPATNSPWGTSAANEVPTKTDDYTVTFNLVTPNVGFPNDLAGTMGYIPSPTAVAKDPAGFGLHPVGTGPFSLSSFEASGQVVVAKNPNYWRKDASGTQLPYLDKITFLPIPDTAKRLQAVQNKDVDLIQTADTSTVVDALKVKSLKVQKVTGSSSTILLFNNKKAPLDDLNVRTALALATDRDAINQTGYQGARTEAYSLFAPDSPYFDKDAVQPKFDLDKAKAAVKAYGKPINITLECIPTPESNTILQLLKEQWEAAGMKITLKTQDQGAYVARIFGKKGDYQVACFRGNQFIEPDQISDNYLTDNKANYGFYSNPEVDKALLAGRATSDFATRKAAYFTVQEQLAKDIPGLALLYNLFGNITTDKVSDLPNPEANSLGALQLATVYKNG
jgi:ABC-type transport system substrate-binding protein